MRRFARRLLTFFSASVLDLFGQRTPRRMPGHFFRGAVHLDYTKAVRADIAKQEYGVCPRHWYVDAGFCCMRCGTSFVFSAPEQRFWYEELKFHVDSLPKRCQECRRALRELKELRHRYDHGIVPALAGDASLEHKTELVAVIDALDQGGIKLPDKMRDNRRKLKQQIENLRRRD